jgi:hypothetical protein
MAGSLSNYAEKKIQDHVFKTSSFTVPTNIYVAFSTADPTDAGTGIAEPSGNNYARVAHNVWASASSRATSNTGVITFPQASGAWGTITHFALFDDPSAGNMLAHGSLSASKVIVSGNVPTIASGDLDISVVTGAMSNYLANKVLDHLLKTAAYTQPTNITVALSTANPGDDGGSIAEPVANNYSRTTCNTWNAANSTTGLVANTSAITTPTASGSWGTISHTALFDNASAGNMLWYGSITPSQAVGANDYMEWAASAFAVTLD